MTTEQLATLVSECQHGRSFSSVRREYGDDAYRAVRDECVRQGRGQFIASEVTEYSDGTIEVRI